MSTPSLLHVVCSDRSLGLYLIGYSVVPKCNRYILHVVICSDRSLGLYLIGYSVVPAFDIYDF